MELPELQDLNEAPVAVLQEGSNYASHADYIQDIVNQFRNAYYQIPKTDNINTRKIITYQLSVKNGELGVNVLSTNYRKNPPHFGSSDSLGLIEKRISNPPKYWTDLDLKIIDEINKNREREWYGGWGYHNSHDSGPYHIKLGGGMEKFLSFLKQASRIIDNGGNSIIIHDEILTPTLQGAFTSKKDLHFVPILMGLNGGTNQKKGLNGGTNQKKGLNGVVNPNNLEVFNDGPVWVKTENHIYPLDKDLTLEKAKLLTTELTVRYADLPEFLSRAYPILQREKRIVLPENIFSDLAHCEAPIPCLYLSEESGSLRLDVKFRYPSLEDSIPHHSEAHILPLQNHEKAFLKRDLEQEKGHMGDLLEILPEHRKDYSIYLAGENAVEFLTERIHPLLNRWEVFGQKDLDKYKFSFHKPRIDFNVSSGIDWFELDGKLTYGDEDVSLNKIADVLRNKKEYVLLSDGTKGALPRSWVNKHKHLFDLSISEKDKIRVSVYHASLLEELINEVDDIESRKKREIVKRLANFRSVRSERIPKSFNGELREYQKKGFDWLYFLYKNRFGGCLADDMGIGKTIQTICLLQKVYNDGEKLPTLIVVPTSLIFNWIEELKRFAPSLRVSHYHGVERDSKVFKKNQVVVTTYGILRREIESITKKEFALVVLDESQYIKNPLSLTARAARKLKTKNRLVLTGTPIENSLIDLWSQFTFLNPGILGGLKYFREELAYPIQKQENPHKEEVLRKIIYPFILRRKKEDVVSDLPEKVETTMHCEMDKDQRRLYDQIREYYRREILKKIDEEGMQKSRMKILEGLIRLRQICCHPRLIDQEYGGVDSCKMDAVTEMIKTATGEGHRILIFSQFVKMLTILRKWFEKHNIPYEYLDGKTRNRQERVDNFQNSEVPVFLISLKAGGFGLNLTGADYVIHYDPWWNPAVEMQATDRAHRIGQDKNVFSYKFVVKDSVEEKIIALQERKKKLVKDILTPDTGFGKLITKKDIEELFG